MRRLLSAGSVALVEIRETGIVACICGTITRAVYEQPVARTLFGREGWHDSDGAFDQLGGRDA